MKYYFKKILSLFALTIFSFMYAMAISLFLSPNNLAPGGLSGIAIMINYLFGVSTGFIIFILNIPLLIISLIKLGKRFFLKTLLAIFLTTFFIDLLSTSAFFVKRNLIPITNDPILAAVIGGFIFAVAIGFIFKLGATTGGTDIVVRLLKLKYPHIETGQLFMYIDFIIVAASAIVFSSLETALYASICIFVTAYFLDKVLYGTDKAILMFVISRKNSVITDALLVDLDIGVTLLNGTGAYTDSPLEIIMCGIKKPLYPKAQNIIYSIDKDAFIIITSANEIVGRGFRPYNLPKL